MNITHESGTATRPVRWYDAGCIKSGSISVGPGNLGHAPKVPPKSSVPADGEECGRFADKPALGSLAMCQIEDEEREEPERVIERTSCHRRMAPG